MRKIILATALAIISVCPALAQFNSGSNYNTVNMSYQANSTISQNIVFDSAMQAGGTFDFSVNAHSGGGRPLQHDTGNVKLEFYNSSGGLVTSSQTNYSGNLLQMNAWSSGAGDNSEPWITITHSYTLSASNAANVAYVKLTLIGTDSSWWAGNYGPQFQMPTLTFNGGSTNILYNPEFGVAPGNVQAQGWTSSTGYSGTCGNTSGSATCVTNSAGVTANMSGGGYSATGGTTSGQPGGYSSTLTSSTILATVNNGGTAPSGGGSGGGSSGPVAVTNASGSTASNPSGTTTLGVTNDGTYTNDGTNGAVTNNSGGTFTNNGTTGDVTNAGTFTNSSGATTGNVTNSGTFANSGTTGTISNSGTFTNNAGGTTGAVTNNSAGTFDNYGTVTTVTNNGTFNNKSTGVTGAVTNNNTFNNDGTTGNVTNTGGFANNGTTGTVSNSGTFVNGATGTTGAFTNSGTLSNLGTLASLTNTGTATNDGTVTGTVTNTSGTFTNNGTTGNWTNSDTIVNSGTMGNGTNNANATFTNSGTVGTVSNAGTFTNNSGATAGDFTNSGTVSNAGTLASLTNTGTATNTGTVTGTVTNTSGTFTNSGTTGDWVNSDTINNSGTMGNGTNNTGATFTNSVGGVVGNVTNDGTFANAGTMGDVTSSGSLDNSGTAGAVTLAGGSFANTGTVASVDNTGALTFTNAGTITGLLTNAGTVTNTGTVGSLTNSGTYTNSGSTGDWTNSNIMSNSGTMGNGTNTGTYTNTGSVGNVTNSGTFTMNSGSLTGISNTGTLDVRGAGNSPAVGNYSQTTPGITLMNFGQTITAGTASLGGTLSAYNMPTAYGRYTLLTSTGLTGSYDTFTTPNASGNGYLKVDGNDLKYYITPSATQTQNSINNIGANMSSMNALRSGAVNNSLGTDCGTFGAYGGCISIGTNATAASNGDLKAGTLTIASRINDHWRIGLFGDGGSNATIGSVEQKNNPAYGMFVGWNQNANGLGFGIVASTAQNTGKMTVKRSAGTDSEAATGTANTDGQAYQIKGVYSHAIDAKTTLTDYVGIRHTVSNVNGYTENGAVFPLTVNSNTSKRTDLIAGTSVSRKLTDNLTGSVSVGIVQAISNSPGTFSGTSEIGNLNNFNVALDKNKPTQGNLGVGLSYEIAKNQRIGATANVSSNGVGTVGIGYSMGF